MPFAEPGTCLLGVPFESDLRSPMANQIEAIEASHLRAGWSRGKQSNLCERPESRRSNLASQMGTEFWENLGVQLLASNDPAAPSEIAQPNGIPKGR